MTSLKTGAAACKEKHDKYTKIKLSNYIFKGLAFKTLGPQADKTKRFFDAIDTLLIKESGDV